MTAMQGAGSLLNMPDDTQWKEKYSTRAPLAPFLFFVGFWMPIYHGKHKAWMAGDEVWSRGEKKGQEKKKKSERKREIWTIQQQRPRKTALSARTAEAPATHTVSLEGLGPQPSNCGSVHWMAAAFTATNGTQKKKKSNVRSASITCVNT